MITLAGSVPAPVLSVDALPEAVLTVVQVASFQGQKEEKRRNGNCSANSSL